MKTLGVIRVLGVPVKVISVTPVEVGNANLLSDNENATYSPDDNIIRMNADSEAGPDFFRFNLVHEFCHALLGMAGVREYLRSRLCVSDEQWEKDEETVVRMMGPALNSALPSLGKVLARVK